MIDVSNGAAERIARGYKPEGYWISPDGSQVTFSAYKIVKPQNGPQAVYDLVVVALAKGQPRIVASKCSYGLRAGGELVAKRQAPGVHGLKTRYRPFFRMKYSWISVALERK